MKCKTAMEYLIIYGWAILIVVIVAAALYALGIFNPDTYIKTKLNDVENAKICTLFCNEKGMAYKSTGFALGVDFVCRCSSDCITYNNTKYCETSESFYLTKP